MYSMKAVTFTLLSLCALTAKAATIDENLMMEYIEDCKKTLKLEDKDLDAVTKGDYSAEESKCFVTCVGEKVGYIQDHEFSVRGALSTLDSVMGKASDADKQKARDIVTQCDKELKDKPPKGCEIGPATALCLAKGALENGIITQDYMAKMQP